jgi:phage terminase large subunit-like protein
MPIDFTESFCKHSQGEWMGRDVELELFQKAFISALFGDVLLQ